MIPELGPRVTAATCRAHDGFSPLSSPARLMLDRARKGKVWACQDGFAVLDDHDDITLMAVSLGARGKGLGASLVAEVVAARPGHSVQAFRTLSVVRTVATKLGLRPVRELLRVGRSPMGIVPVPALTGYRILSFEPSDAEGVVEANRAAFTHHPEQGRLIIDGFQALIRQPWFNAAGLLATYHSDEMAGFYQTKYHDASLGKVYVLTVCPGHGGVGSGRIPLTAGLTHLHTVNREDVELYVEVSEGRVVALYAAIGLRTLTVDTTCRGGDTS